MRLPPLSDEDQLQFLTGIANRISRQEDVMAQVSNHSVEQVLHGLFPERVPGTLLDAMTDHAKTVAGSVGQRDQEPGVCVGDFEDADSAGWAGQTSIGAAV